MLKLIDNIGKTYLVDESLEINRGGEGRIIPIGNNKVVKLYFDPTRAISQQKIDELSQLDDKFFLKPKNSLKGDANGFIMDELKTNEYYPLYTLFSPNFVMKHNLSSDFKIKIADKLVEAVNIAHNANIVIGDLNPFNIMVNDNLDVKFIDVDSYQTPSSKHNDKLLEDIRDYVNNGVVNKESDCFALAVIIFNLFTYIHPYKGIHSVYGNKIKDRMINNCSIISSEQNNIKIPKFYQPITDNNLLLSFDLIFNKGQRFIIDLHGVTVKPISFDGIVMSYNLIITDLLSGNIINVASSKNYLAITTDTNTVVYNTPTKGVITNLLTVTNNINIILTDKHIFGFKDGILKLYDIKNKCFNQIEGLCVKNISIVKQYENILIIITNNDEMYKIYLDEVFGNSIKYTITKVYSKSFHKREGMFQHIGSSNNIFYNSGKDISIVNITNSTIQDIKQYGNVGILSSWKNNDKSKLVYELFTINTLGQIKTAILPDDYSFTANDNFIIIYYEDMLRFINKETLVEVVSFKTNGLDGYSILNTNTGIIAFNSNNVKILNSK